MIISYHCLGHVCFYCKDYENMMNFYTGVLGFEKACDLNDHEGKLRLSYLKIGKEQFIELFNRGYETDNSLAHRSFGNVCLVVEDLQKTMLLLKDKGIVCYQSGSEQSLPVIQGEEDSLKAKCGSLCAYIKDPEQNHVKLMELTLDSLQQKKEGITGSMISCSIRCNDLERAVQFYKDVLGLQEAFSIQDDAGTPFVYAMRVNATQYIELFQGTYEKPEDGKKNSFRHICLVVDDILKASEVLERQGIELKTGSAACINPYVFRPYPNKAGTFMVYDPEGNEIEFMQYKE